MSPSLIGSPSMSLSSPRALVDDADGDVAGDDRERDVELAVMEMDVGAAHLGVERLEQRGAGFELRLLDLGDGERGARGGHHDGFRHFSGGRRAELLCTALRPRGATAEQRDGRSARGPNRGWLRRRRRN